MEVLFTEEDLESAEPAEPATLKKAPRGGARQAAPEEPSLFGEDELPIPGLESPEALRARLFGEAPRGPLVLDGGSPVPQVGAAAPAWMQGPILEDDPFPAPSSWKPQAAPRPAPPSGPKPRRRAAEPAAPADPPAPSRRPAPSIEAGRPGGPKVISSPADVLKALKLKRAAIPKASDEAGRADEADRPERVAQKRSADREPQAAPLRSDEPAASRLPVRGERTAEAAPAKPVRRRAGGEPVEFVREDGLVVSMDAETCRDPETLRRARRLQKAGWTAALGGAAEADAALAYVRDDGLLVEMDGDTCTDPEVFREAKRRRAAAADRPARPRAPLAARAVAALARREYSRKELRRKLLRTLGEDETPEALDRVLDGLEAKGFLSDERYAGVRARSFAPRMGDARIKRELRMKGVDEETAREAVEAIEEPEPLRAWRIWRRRYDELPKNWKEREKQLRYLAYRGFSMSAIMQVLRGEVELPEDEDGGSFG